MQHLWKRWSKDYLNGLQQRNKWKTISPNVDINTLVLIKEKRMPPARWLMDRVVETHPGKDGLVRVVSVRTSVGVLQRPLVKLVLLPVAPPELDVTHQLGEECFCYNGNLPIKKVDPNVKMNLLVLNPLFDNEAPFLYPSDSRSVWLHQAKATSHTSRSIRQYLDEKMDETGISYIHFRHIPTNYPDLAPMDFCAFGLFKTALRYRKPKTLEGLWKV
ncbi:hypothetical protein LAZ67_4003764 [Cordylochernes scorpioides]|uniref:DUF5641 domain-containing protein n=1 Tax=Cordylochernes scorpioides TaxID=51811 RepID=A0ABY6KGZ5_9ARAC|nr:hypothetical protein LAZ67_4003764 [Cordylochernes scorpioides]